MKTTIVVAWALSLLAAPALARDVMYPVLPGTSLRDYGKPGYTVDRHDDGSTTFHPTLPGTSIRDYGKTDYFVK